MINSRDQCGVTGRTQNNEDNDLRAGAASSADTDGEREWVTAHNGDARGMFRDDVSGGTGEGTQR